MNLCVDHIKESFITNYINNEQIIINHYDYLLKITQCVHHDVKSEYQITNSQIVHRYLNINFSIQIIQFTIF